MDARWTGLVAVMGLAFALPSAHAAPVEETRDSIAVVHGGIGEEDRAAMAQKAADHNLRLTFARKGSGAKQEAR